MLGISWVAAQLAASQEGLSSMSECLSIRVFFQQSLWQYLSAILYEVQAKKTVVKFEKAEYIRDYGIFSRRDHWQDGLSTTRAWRNLNNKIYRVWFSMDPNAGCWRNFIGKRKTDICRLRALAEYFFTVHKGNENVR
jgi:hypothetical protein